MYIGDFYKPSNKEVVMNTSETEVLESFTIYGENELKSMELDRYSSLFTINSVKNYKGAFDLIPKESLTEIEIQKEREKLISDPLILDVEANYEEISLIPDEENKEVFWGIDDVDTETAKDYLWHHKVMNIKEAWQVTKHGKREKGDGIVIAHPDSGYINHPELLPMDKRILKKYQKDFIDSDNDPTYAKATHGLATASVILGNEEGLIKGIAPKAFLIPMRVAKIKLLPTPVLISGGRRRLRLSIEHAIESEADIISISLGGLKGWGKASKRVLDEAKRQGIIVLAAAGNHVHFVVYPAKYSSVIAVAASNFSNKEWSGSSRGNSVVITAPGENVWKADTYTENKIDRSSGTSYAVANVAGVAALWLAHWGKSALEETFGGKDKIVDGFIKMLKDTASSDHDLPYDGFGAGIVDAKKLLSLNLVKYRIDK